MFPIGTKGAKTSIPISRGEVTTPSRYENKLFRDLNDILGKIMFMKSS